MVRQHEQSEHSRDAFRCACAKSFSCSENLRRHSRSTGHFIPDTFRLPSDDSADSAGWEIVQPSASSQTVFAPGTVEARQAQGNMLWCHVFLDKRVPEFDLLPKLIGEDGCNMREIFEATKARLRVRGRGSGNLEVDDATEAPVPLMVAVTSEGVDQALFITAVEMTISRLRVVQGLFVEFCQQQKLSVSLTNLWRFGEMSKDAEIVLAGLLPEGGWPQLAR